MDETFEQVVERLAKELHEKVYVPQAMALGYILGPQANVPFDELPQEGKELMRRIAAWAVYKIGTAGEEAFAAGRTAGRAAGTVETTLETEKPADETPKPADETPKPADETGGPVAETPAGEAEGD